MLDPAVAIATSALMSLMLLALLGSLLRSGVPGVLEWFLANLLLVVALPLLLLRGSIPDIISVVFANVLVALSAVTYYAGCARFMRRPVYWLALSCAVVVVGLALVYLRYVVDSIPARVLITTMFTAAICILVAYSVSQRRRPGRSAYPYRVTAVLALIFGMCQAARGVYFMSLSDVSNPLMFASQGSVVLLAVAAAMTPMLSMAAMMMVHDALLADARDAANRDFLTGALSRKGFEAVADLRLKEVRKQGLELSLLVVDLDHFKSVNDTFGHAGGDAVLRDFVRMTQLQLRRGDVLGRMGGEEFAVLLPRTAPGDALHLAERLCVAAASRSVQTPSGMCRYSISGGIAGWLAGETFDHLNMRADRALYEAKQAGRNTVRVHQPTRAASIAPLKGCDRETVGI